MFEDREPGHEPRWQRWLPRSIGIKPLNQQSSQATAWFSRWKASFERIRQRFGMPVAVLLALLVAGGPVGGRRRRFGELDPLRTLHHSAKNDPGWLGSQHKILTPTGQTGMRPA